MNPDEVGAWLDENRITSVRTEGVGTDGLVIGKVLSRRKFEKALPLGNAITDLVFGYDLGGTAYLAWWDEWRRDALGDFHQRPDTSTLVAPASTPGQARCLVDHVTLDGTPLPVCPRSRLRAIDERVNAHGYDAIAAFEIEFMVYRESFDAARRRGFRNLTPFSIPTPLGYSIDNAYRTSRFMDAVCRRLDELGVPWEAWHDEAAPGQVEVNIEPAPALNACDHAVRVRQAVREVAVDLGHCVTFMAKPSPEYGNGLHVHHSLRQNGSPVFYDADAPDQKSDVFRQWLGGLVASLTASTSIMAPTINSYRRLVGWAAAPTTPTWGEDNKSTAIRVMSRSAAATRVEHRLAAADANPYLVLATVLASGLSGLDHDLAAGEPLRVAGWGLPPSTPHLPNTITTSADALAAATLLREQLGDAFVDYWINTRRWEWLMFHTSGGDPEATSVTDWELMRYFEVV